MAVLALLLALWQAPPAVQPDKCTLEGQVVRIGAGEPLRKAQVSLSGAAGNARKTYTTSTDDGGHFALKEIEPGRYRLWAERNGYLHAEYGQGRPGRPGTLVTLESGQRLKDLVLKMTPYAIVAGRVIDEDNEPRASVHINAMRESFERGRRELVPAGAAMTNDLGEYRMFNLPPGRYFMAAVPESPPGGFQVERQGAARADEDYVSVFYPGVTDAGMAAPLQLAAGSEMRGVDFRLARVRTYRIRGRVLNAAGAPARGVMLMLSPRHSAYASASGRGVSQDADGNFSIAGVPSGSYTLTAFLFEASKRQVGRAAVDVADGNVDGILVELGAGMELSGAVRMEGGSALPERMVLRFEGRTGNSSPAATIHAGGTFTVPGLAPDSYSVAAYAMGDSIYLKSARAGGVDVLAAGLDLLGSRPPGPLEIVLSPNGARVSGTVTDDAQRPVASATAVLVPEAALRSQTRLFRSSTADQNGRFSFRGLPPGEYTLYAFDDVEPGEWLNPEFLRDKKGETLKLDENAQQSLQIRVNMTGSAQ